MKYIHPSALLFSAILMTGCVGSDDDADIMFDPETVSTVDENPIDVVDTVTPEDELPGDISDDAGDQPDNTRVDGTSPNVTCAPLFQDFSNKILPIFTDNTCTFCHIANGPAGDTQFILDTSASDENNYLAVYQFLNTTDGPAFLTSKPVGGDDHGGSAPLSVGSQEEADLINFRDRAVASPECNDLTAITPPQVVSVDEPDDVIVVGNEGGGNDVGIPDNTDVNDGTNGSGDVSTPPNGGGDIVGVVDDTPPPGDDIVIEPVNLKVIYAINLGSDEDFTSADGQLFEGEVFVVDNGGDGGTSGTEADIQGTEDDELYASQRWGKYKVELPVTEGSYNVTILTAETFHDRAGRREMDIEAEGIILATRLDLFSVAGQNNAYEISESNIAVEDGTLDLLFEASEDQATISAILVTSADGAKGEASPVSVQVDATDAVDLADTKGDVEQINGTSIEKIDCGQGDLPGNTRSIFSASNTFDGSSWSHVTDPSKAGDFNGLRQPLNEYGTGGVSSSSDCSGDGTHNVTLVKKYHTWENTHSNGLKKGVNGVAVGDIESLVIELKINSNGTYVPTVQDVRQAYPFLSEGQVNELDQGMVNIDFVFEAGDKRSNKILRIDQNKYADEWIRITIPMENMDYYSEVNYNRTYTDYNGSRGQSYNGLTVDAETQSGSTVQALNGGTPGGAFLFKEVDVSIHRIDYILR